MKRIWRLLKAIWRWFLLLFAVQKVTETPEESNEDFKKDSKRDNKQENLPEKVEKSPISNVSRNPISDKSVESKNDIKEIVKKLLGRSSEEYEVNEGENDYNEETTGVYCTYNVDNYRVIREDYYSINSLVHTLRKRPNNTVMEDNHSSKNGDSSFTGTMTYESAEKLLLDGWGGILNMVKLKYDKKVDILSHKYIRKKSSNIDAIVGGTPNVPRALMCLPNNLINRVPSVKKINAIEIIYDVTVDCSIKINEVLQSGIALLSAIKLLEQSGVQLKLTCCFFSSVSTLHSEAENREIVIGSVLLKNYAEKLNLLKICFPLAHSSMVRRIGFKFLETIPGITNKAFRFGYGHTVPVEDLRKALQAENTVVLDYYTIADELNFDTEKLIKYIEDYVKKQN